MLDYGFLMSWMQLATLNVNEPFEVE
jgi:hypothetical protein